MSTSYAAMLSRVLVAQRTFHHELLYRLVQQGSLRQEDAVAIASASAEIVRDMPANPLADEFAEMLARGYEEIAAAMAGLPPIRGPNE
jgi:hypothetical protein